MFIDRVNLKFSAGKGGAGCVSFHREKFIIQGGPDGGDGGRGGSIYIEVDNNTDTLSAFRGKSHIKAEGGQPGMARKCYGRSGKDLIIKVPPGTQITNVETDEVLCDLFELGAKHCIVKGGKGGLGNVHFKSSTNQRPTYAQPGLAGDSFEVSLELKLIADVGLVGFPNVGKSTLISSISSATPEVANYEFTTLTPKLGVVDSGDYQSFVMADIPGIIGGASEGRGLGHEFLRHIERTKHLLFMLDIANYRTLEEQFTILLQELKNYSEVLSEKKFGIAITRVDVYTPEEGNALISEFLEAININGKMEDKFLTYFPKEDVTGEYEESEISFVIPISSISRSNIPKLVYHLDGLVNQ
jgi:GTP-binding protein